MKKILFLILTIFTLGMSANVAPFYFDDVPASLQQTTWDELTKYKLWGTESFSIGGNSKIPDESGRNGTTGNLTGTGNETLLGGPIFVEGNINVGHGYTFPTGPTVADTFTIVGLNDGFFGGTLCLADTNVSDDVRRGLERAHGELSNDCEGYPKPTGLKIPNVTWPDSTLHSINVGMHGTDTIHIPEGEGQYDIYLSGITMGDESKLYIALPDTGRLVRIFVNGEISLGNHAVIQTMNNGLPIPNDEYAGNLLFYTTEDMVFDNTDYCIRQGTYISAKTFYLKQQVTFAGQMLATNLVIGNNVDGKNFLFVGFDNPKIKIGDPTTNALGNFKENDLNVEIPIYLDTLAPVLVTFNYCFILNDDATLDDFNTDKAPIEVCGTSEGKVRIEEGTSTPANPVYVNVKIDDIAEGTEVVGFKIYNISGAVLPGNKKAHVFTLTLEDSDYTNKAPELDKNAKFDPYLEEQLIPPGSGVIGKVKVTDEKPENLKYELVDTTGLFFIDSTGTIKTTHVFDYETEDTVYVVTVKVDDGELRDSADYIIKIGNVNEPIEVKAELADPYEGPADSVIGGIIGYVNGTDIDGTKVIHTIVDPTNTFKIDSITGVITITKELDYETKNEYPVTVKMVSEDGSKKDTSFVIKVKDVNEKHTIDDETKNVPEDTNVNTPVDTVKVKDPDFKNAIEFELIDTTGTFKIDSNGVITVVKPLDYETKNEYNVVVIAKDKDFADTANIKIKVSDVLEKSDLKITEVDTKKFVYTDNLDKPIYTNNSDVKLSYKTDGSKIPLDTNFTLKQGENVIELCYLDSTKNVPGCDTVTIYYSDNEPSIIVTVNDDKYKNKNGVTIVDQPDGFNYVNYKNPEIFITVKDTENKTNDTTFSKRVDLEPIKVNSKELKNINIEPSSTKINLDLVISVKDTGDMKKVTEEVTHIIDGKTVNATMTYFVDKNGYWIEKIPYTVEYTKNVDGRDIKISYETNGSTSEVKKYNVTYKQINDKDTIEVSYPVSTDGKVIENKEGNVGYTISYSYTNKYGNKGSSSVFIYLDERKPEVQILTPAVAETYYTNSINVVWTVDGVEQDTLNLQRLEKGPNQIIRCYMDKANNTTCDSVFVYMKNAKDIDIALVKPVTEIDKDKVDEFYSNYKYDAKKPYIVKTVDPKADTIPNVIGPALKIDIVMPQVNSTGGLATFDDILQTVNGKTGVLVDKYGKLISGTSTGDDGSYTIDPDEYIANYCTDDFRKDFVKNGASNTGLWNVKMKIHIWIFDNSSHYVNDFIVDYDLNNTNMVNDAGILQLVLDMIPDTDGYVKSKNKNAIGTGAYLTKLEVSQSNMIRCTTPDYKKNDHIKKREHDLIIFGYKRPRGK